ncbi:MAG: DUF3267 domain-containing protein [Clostridiales bacterium]|nr:DUF3267 domain-containing protein [Clostridiales bacterium]
MTKDEQKRLEFFEEESRRLEAEGYTGRDLTTSALNANLLGTLLGALVAAPGVVVFLLRKFEVPDISGWRFTVIVIAGVISIVVHELIHGITWSLFAKNRFRSIAFGFIVEYLTPYCSCKEPLSGGAYSAGGIMPCIILGLIPEIIACFTGNAFLLGYGAFMTVCAGGDLLIISMILRDKKTKDALFFDHPTKVGLVKFVKKTEDQ